MQCHPATVGLGKRRKCSSSADVALCVFTNVFPHVSREIDPRNVFFEKGGVKRALEDFFAPAL